MNLLSIAHFSLTVFLYALCFLLLVMVFVGLMNLILLYRDIGHWLPVF